MRPRAVARRARLERDRPEWAAFWWLLVGITAVMLTAGCRQAAEVLEPAARAADPNGTITGTVRGPAGATAIEGRVVEVVNVDTRERQRATTGDDGGFSFQVAPGTYRVEVALRHGEALLKGPGVMQVGRSDRDAQADFVIAPRSGGTASRPRGPAYQLDPGLGSPIA